MTPRQFRLYAVGSVLVQIFLLAAIVYSCTGCGASAREQTLRTTFVATKTAQEAFVAWDGEHQLAIARNAPSKLIGLAELTTYREKRGPVLAAFEATYRALAAAAILEDDHKSLASALAAAEQLQLALRTLTGRSWP